jgi:hypothetical protein
MAASHPHLFQSSVAYETEIHKLVVNHFLPDRAMLQWRPAAGEDISTPNTEEIMVFSSFFQRGLGLPACDFLQELVHLSPNSILQITVFVHLCEAFLGISPNFPLFKNYFFLKYQLSASNRKVIGGVGLQTHPHASFLNLPMKSSLWGWHGIWFYCENHKPCLPSFVDRLLEFHGTWSEESTPLDAPQVAALINKVNLLKDKGLTGVCVATHWLARRVQSLKKQVHLGWEYNGSQDPTRETQEKITLELLTKHLGEMFQDTFS